MFSGSICIIHWFSLCARTIWRLVCSALMSVSSLPVPQLHWGVDGQRVESWACARVQNGDYPRLGVSAVTQVHLVVQICSLAPMSDLMEMIFFPLSSQKTSSLSNQVTSVTWTKLCPLSCRYRVLLVLSSWDVESFRARKGSKYGHRQAKWICNYLLFLVYVNIAR